MEWLWSRCSTPWFNNTKVNEKSRTILCTQTRDYDEVEEQIVHQEHTFPNNRIRNTKYTLLSFLPKALVEQFSLHMNQYFLLLAFLQLWKTISPVNPISTWIPLIVVVGLGMLKELIDDIMRYFKDREANHKIVCVLRDDGRRVQTKSMDVHVGDLVLVRENEPVCADLVVLQTSEMGTCYIETSALDGERDYKERLALKSVQAMPRGEIYGFNGQIQAPAPNPEINKFEATLYLDEGSLSLSEKNLLLQGTFLKSTDWVVGIVVYSGNQTKIGMNKQNAQIKWTRSDTFINRCVVFIFLAQIFFAVTLGTAGNIMRSKVEKAFYIGYPENYSAPIMSYIVIPLRFLLLCSLMIPQSLKVTSDLCKYALSWLISYDIKLYDEKSDTRAGVSNTSICEDLGQIEYLFTDKTGTLTENIMIFKSCIVDGKEYQCDPVSSELNKLLKSRNKKITLFMQTIAICNTVFSSIDDNGEMHFHSSSPDEEALINFVMKHNVQLLHHDHEIIRFSIFDDEEEFQILNVLEFCSSRRRMSVIVKSTDGTIFVFSKGADDAMLSILNESEDVAVYRERVKELAMKGLRTLCMGYKTMSLEEYDLLRKQLHSATCATENRAQEVDSIYAKIESNLTYLGCSGIEDALQEDVPETIQALRDAGIVVWMLTGDKKETAMIIGYSCSLLNRKSESSDGSFIIHLTGSNTEELTMALDSALEEVEHVDQSDIACVIEGSTLKHIFTDDSMNTSWFFKSEDKAKQANLKKLVELTTKCKSVICCRMSPIQKGKIVRMMKGSGFTRKRCLAVGDGGNDVTMILESDVGVGISGKEGLQAVRAADFSIARFKFLKRLLLVHGHHSYRRMSFVTLYTMYKSLIIAFCQLLFALFSAFSGAPLLNSFALTTYNLLFTAVFPVAFLFDKDVSDESLEQIPELYKESKDNSILNVKTLLLWIAYAAFQAIVIVLGVSLLINGQYLIGHNGITLDYWSQGTIVFTIVMTIQFLDIVLLIKSWSLLSVIVTIGSYLMFIAVTTGYSMIPFISKQTTMFMVVPHLVSDPGFFVTCFVLVVAAMLPLAIYLYSTSSLSALKISSCELVRQEEASTSRKKRNQQFYMDLREKVQSLESEGDLHLSRSDSTELTRLI